MLMNEEIRTRTEGEFDIDQFCGEHSSFNLNDSRSPICVTLRLGGAVGAFDHGLHLIVAYFHRKKARLKRCDQESGGAARLRRR